MFHSLFLRILQNNCKIFIFVCVNNYCSTAVLVLKYVIVNIIKD